MELDRFLISGFDYDRWANRSWIKALGGFKRLEKAQDILEHMLAAQRIWLERCNVQILPQEGDLALSDLFDITTQTWIAVIEASSVDEVIQYRTMRGDEYQSTIGQIALHVINHGTYHRGQLRQLAEEDGFTAYPETDLILYFREHRA